MKFNTTVTCGRGDVVDDLVCLFHAAKFLCVTVNDGARCISRRRGVELERAKGNVDIELDTFASKVCQGCFEALFADIAPWANNIRPNFYVHKVTLEQLRVQVFTPE